MIKFSKYFRTFQMLLLIGSASALAFAQSGDISASTSNFTTLGGTILKLLVVLAGLGFVGLIIWGGLTLTTNRPRGLAMIGGGLTGALLAGLAFAIVSTLTGNNVSTLLLAPTVQQFFVS
jgi:hypothetical protein